MASFTTRLGLTKPAGAEARAVGPLNTNSDLLDKFLPCILVNDGVTPPTGDLYDGALVKERTSGIIWEARKNGGGTFDKVYVRYPCLFVGQTINQSVTSGTLYQAIGYSTWQAGKNTSAANITGGRFVVPVKGIWSMHLKASYAVHATGQRGLTFENNAAMMNTSALWLEVTTVASSSGAGFDTHLEIHRDIEASAGTQFAGGVWQNSGGNLNITHSATYTLVEPTQ